MNEKKKPKYRKQIMAIQIPVCPICGQDLEEIQDPEIRTLYVFKCNTKDCGYIY